MYSKSAIKPEMESRVAGDLRWVIFGGIGVVLAVVTWMFTLAAASFECTLAENTPCASSSEPTEYRGRLFDYEGRPAGRFVLNFHSDLYGRRFHARVRTDRRGRFCVEAVPSNEASAYIEVPGQNFASQLIVRSDGPIDPRFRDPLLRASLRRGSNYHGVDRMPLMTIEPVSRFVNPPSPSITPSGAHAATELWDRGADATPVCQGVGKSPPWYRIKGAETSWQFSLLTAITVATLGLFVIASVARVSPIEKHARGMFKTTLGTGVATLIVACILWAVA